MILYKKKEMCCGCTACMNICPKRAITMKQDEEGFLYPLIDEDKCVNCGLCKKVCAFQEGYEVKDRLNNLEVYATKNRDDEIRKVSSSGGMFTLIAKEILNKKGVVYGAAFDDKFRVKHIRVETEEELSLCRGSKYSQSSIGETFRKVKEDLKNERQVLFTGTPCQIAGLRKCLTKSDVTNLFVVDIICHGTPSPKLFQEYIKFIEGIKRKRVIEYYHRSKKFKWPTTGEEVVYESNKHDYKSRLSQTWRNIFYSNLALRPSCYNCQYTKIERPGDMTIADFWGIENYEKDFSDKMGVSLLLVNTKKGANMYDIIQKNMLVIERRIEDAIEKNPQLKNPVKISKTKRIEFWENYYKYGIKKIVSKYGGYNTLGQVKHLIKKILKRR